jgi:predicted ribosome quality control (RQC) complex YloA/Tae2 family protein
VTLNWKEIDRILEELDLCDSMIRQIHGPDCSSIMLELYRYRDGQAKAFKIYISVSNPNCRLHLLTRKLDNPSRPHRFITLLRAHIRGGKITSANQIDGERIVKLDIRTGERAYHLWIRLWAGAANVLLTDTDNRILDALYRRPKRKEISGERFKLDMDQKQIQERQKEYEVREFSGEGSFNERVERHFFDLEERAERQALKRRALQDLEARENGNLLRMQQLKERLKEYSQADRWRELGDLVKSSVHRIAQGDRWLKTEDFYRRNKIIEIQLDPQLSAIQNAEQFYKKYRQAKRDLGKIEEDLRSISSTLKEIREKKEQVKKEEDLKALRVLSRKPQTRQKEKARMPGVIFDSNRFRIIVGKTSRDNDILLRNHVNGNDYWFHCRDYPGAYVFVRLRSKPSGAKGEMSIPLDTMLDAANLALFYSKAKNSGQADVYYTQVKYLRRAKSGKTGLVVPTSEKNLFVCLDPKRIERLKKSKTLY